MTPEAEVKVALKKRLEDLGLYYFMPVQTGYGQRTLDFLVCGFSHFYGIETKAPGEVPTFQQDCVAARIIAAGGIVYVIDNVEAAARFDPHNPHVSRPYTPPRGLRFDPGRGDFVLDRVGARDQRLHGGGPD